MKLPTVSVEFVEDDGRVTGFRLAQPALVADPMRLADMERTISLLYSYREVMKRLIEMAAPTTARRINDGELANERPA
jgi:CO/xanthine dehydrogenase FAD-binding subunit